MRGCAGSLSPLEHRPLCRELQSVPTVQMAAAKELSHLPMALLSAVHSCSSCLVPCTPVATAADTHRAAARLHSPQTAALWAATMCSDNPWACANKQWVAQRVLQQHIRVLERGSAGDKAAAGVSLSSGLSSSGLSRKYVLLVNRPAVGDSVRWSAASHLLGGISCNSCSC